ncbi:ribonuclease III [Thermodesulfobacteriota bacterium]
MDDGRRDLLRELEEILGYVFRDCSILDRALTHSSYANETAFAHMRDNERLEFLGDAVLGLSITDLIMEHFPDAPEGEMTRIRSALVNETQLAEVSQKMGFGKYLLLGRGEEMTGGRVKSSILADTYEAILGALYMDGGYAPSIDVVRAHFSEKLEEAHRGEIFRDYKTSLQEIVQARYGHTPVYVHVGESGPDHEKVYEVEIRIAEELFGNSQGRSKKEAEQKAAEAALKMIIHESTGVTP